MVRTMKGGIAARQLGPTGRTAVPPWVGFLLVASFTGMVAGCASFRRANVATAIAPAVPAAARDQKARQPIGKGRLVLGGDEDFVVRIVAPATTCSGTLIAEDLVLTAHHCVSVRDGKGRMLPADLDPERLTVELGSGHFPWAELPVKAIVAPACGYEAGAGDLAILVLPKRLRGIRTVHPSLDREPQNGDEVSHVGFGRCAMSDDGIYLKHRAAGRIDLVSKTGFRVNVPLCPGDSGGPVMLHASRVLIGVVSAGAMDGSESTPDRVEFSRLDPFRSLFANATRVAAGTPISELPPVDCPLAQPGADAIPTIATSPRRR